MALPLVGFVQSYLLRRRPSNKPPEITQVIDRSEYAKLLVGKEIWWMPAGKPVGDMHFERRGAVMQLRVREAPPEAWRTVRTNELFQKGATYRAVRLPVPKRRQRGAARGVAKKKRAVVLARKLSTVIEEGVAEADGTVCKEEGLIEQAGFCCAWWRRVKSHSTGPSRQLKGDLKCQPLRTACSCVSRPSDC